MREAVVAVKLTVKNFGPIKSAEVEVGPMTVFVGPSNTGKSYLAGLVYAVAGALNQSFALAFLQIFFRDKETASELVGMPVNSPASLKNLHESPQQYSSLVEKMFRCWTKGTSGAWKEKMKYCFGQAGMDIFRSAEFEVCVSGKHGGITLNLCHPEKSKLPKELHDHLLDASLSSTATGEADNFLHHHILPFLSEEEWNDLMRVGSSLHRAAVVVEAFAGQFSPSHTAARCLPADRGGIMQNRQALVASTLQKVAFTGLSAAEESPPLNGITADFLRAMTVLKAERQKQRESDDAGKKIVSVGKAMEKSVLAGEIKVHMSETGFPDYRYAYRQNGATHELPLMNASSMVAELAPVSLLLRHYVNPGDLFIIEEPESHLHPGAQRDIVNYLVQLVNAGVRVLITTHSDVLLEQINNYAHAHDIKKKLRGQSLHKAKLSAYAFNRAKSGTKVKAIEFHPERGILSEDHLRASNALYDEVVGLMEAKNRANG